MDIDAYLDRIGLSGTLPANEQTLADLVERHILTVPFENLDIPLGRGIHLGSEHLFEKIVSRRRGGYCFELNGLFGILLDRLGFDRRQVLARVWFRGPTETPALTHTFNIVTLGDRELMVDVGFGGTTARLPVPLEHGASVTDVDGPVTVRRDPEHGFMLTREMPHGSEDQFSTTGAAAYPSDLAVSNHFMATSPKSHFTQMAVAGRFLPEGRVGLVDRTLTLRHGWSSSEQPVTSAGQLRTVLQEHFGLDLGDDHEKIFDPGARGGTSSD